MNFLSFNPSHDQCLQTGEMSPGRSQFSQERSPVVEQLVEQVEDEAACDRASDREIDDDVSVLPAVFQSPAEEFDGELIVAKVNTDENSEWAMKYGVQGIPTMLFIKDGEVIREQVGALPEPILRELVDGLLAGVQFSLN